MGVACTKDGCSPQPSQMGHLSMCHESKEAGALMTARKQT